MSLLLQVITVRGAVPSTAMEYSFDRIGGSIGRAEDNDLTLPDPGRAISRVHARIEWRDGAYLLQDLGSNPSLLNQASLGPVRSARLSHGDVMTIGDYRLQVSIDESDATAAPVALSPWATAATAPLVASTRDAGTGLDGVLGSAGRREPSLSEQARDDDWTSALGVNGAMASGPVAGRDILGPGLLGQDALVQGPLIYDALVPKSMGQASLTDSPFTSTTTGTSRFDAPDVRASGSPFASVPETAAPSPWPATPMLSSASAPSRVSTTIPADFDPFAMPEQVSAPAPAVPRPTPGGVPRPRAATEAIAAAPAFASAVVSPALGSAAPPAAVPAHLARSSDDEVFRALLKGLGQPAVVLGKRSQADLAELAGQLLREAIDGAMGLLAANKPLSAETPHLAARDNNPLKCFPEVDSALTQMLSTRRATYSSGPKAIWAAFDELRSRERISHDAVQAAVAGVIARFEPTALARRMDEDGLPGGWRAGGRAAQYWERLPSAHAAIAREAQQASRRVSDPLSFSADEYSAVRKNVVEP